MRTGRHGSRGPRIPRPAILMAAVLLVAACGGAAAPNLSILGNAVEPESADRDAVGGQTGDGESAAFRDDARIIRTGTMQLQVEDVERAVAEARARVTALGGYIGASRQASLDEGVIAEVTYRIPVDRWEETLTGLRSLALKVLDEQIEAVEVTGQVVDLAARIRNLEASEEALQAIAARATEIKDVLAVQKELTDVRGQIEQLAAQKQDLEDRAALATMTVTYGVEVVAVKQAAKDWNASSEVDRAAASLIDVLQSVATAGIWFGIVWLPILVVLVILALIVRVITRRTGLLDRVLPLRARAEPTQPTGTGPG